MAIKKQEFYEGAALHMLIRSGDVQTLGYDDPYFYINGTTIVYIKYSTKKRHPWG